MCQLLSNYCFLGIYKGVYFDLPYLLFRLEKNYIQKYSFRLLNIVITITVLKNRKKFSFCIYSHMFVYVAQTHRKNIRTS
jgi:hypothetical protein